MIAEGKKPPNFKLPDADGEIVDLSKLKGRPVVVYFYPKDDTSGCTKQAQAFQAHLDAFEAAGATILGISPQDVKSKRKFADKHGLTFRLLADTDTKAAEAYGVWVEKSMYGRTYMGVERSTFLIDKAGKLARSWRKVKVPGHAEEVLEAVKALS